MAAQPAPLSVRLDPALLKQVDALAEREGCSRHAAVLRLLNQALGNTPRARDPQDVLHRAEAKAAHLGAPRPLKTPSVLFNPPRSAKPKRSWKV